MLLEHLMIPNRNIPHEMIITHLLKFFKIDVSAKMSFLLLLTSITPFLIGCKPACTCSALSNSTFKIFYLWFLLFICKSILCSHGPNGCPVFELLCLHRKDFDKSGRVSKHICLCMLVSTLLSSVCRLFFCLV